MSAKEIEKSLSVSVKLSGCDPIALIKPGLVKINGDELHYRATEVELGLMHGLVDLFSSAAVEAILLQHLPPEPGIQDEWKALIRKLNSLRQSRNEYFAYSRLLRKLLQKIPLKLSYRRRNTAAWATSAQLIFRDKALTEIANQLVDDIEVSGRYKVEYESFCGQVLIPGKGFADINQTKDFKTFLLQFHQKEQQPAPALPASRLAITVACGEEKYNLIPSEIVTLNGDTISFLEMSVRDSVIKGLVGLFSSAGVKALLAEQGEAVDLAMWDYVVAELASARQDRMLQQLMQVIPLRMHYKNISGKWARDAELSFAADSVDELTNNLTLILGNSGRFHVRLDPSRMAAFTQWLSLMCRQRDKANLRLLFMADSRKYTQFITAVRAGTKPKPRYVGYGDQQIKSKLAEWLLGANPRGILVTEGAVPAQVGAETPVAD